MKNPVSWLKRLLSGDGASRVMTLFSPPVVQERGPMVRAAVAGGTVLGLVVAGAIGMVAAAALIFAIAAIWFLATQVLGIKVNVDPAAFYQTMQRQAASYTN